MKQAVRIREKEIERERKGRGGNERGEMVAYQKLLQRSLDEETLEYTPEGGRRSCGETQCDRSDDFQRELLQFIVFPAFFRVIPTSFVGRGQMRKDG